VDPAENNLYRGESFAALPWLRNPLWRRVLDVVPAGLVAVDDGGTIVYWSPYADMLLGIRAADALGQHFRDTFCPQLPMEQCWVVEALDSATPRRGHRFQLAHPEGHRTLLDGDLTPFTDAEGAVLGALVAVREADPHESSPVAAPSPLDGLGEAIIDSVADGLYTVDHEFRITSFNRAAERLTGLREADVVGRICRHVLHADRCVDDCPLAATLESGSNQFGREVILREDSPNWLPVRVNTAVLRDAAGTPIGGVVTFRDAERAVPALTAGSAHYEGIVGRHASMRQVYSLIDEVAESDASVLILGESGTGKERVAEALVRRSRRREAPCVKVNCSVLPDTLLESELFGHVRGAFTDARQDRRGRFLAADGGTVFLDEIGDISPAAQLKLLRVLEERAFEPLGSSRTVHVDVRVIAATNRDLTRLIAEGRFREDLYYRLNVIPVHLPPLRDRREDIPDLVEHFVARFRKATGKVVDGVSDEAMTALMAHDYPGNVRELENAIEHAFARTVAGRIEADRLPLALRVRRGAPHAGDPTRIAGASRPDAATADERQRIVEALDATRWRREAAARRLGISRTTLWRRMQALGIDGD
jgi:PAS domain S-box-containing protein